MDQPNEATWKVRYVHDKTANTDFLIFQWKARGKFVNYFSIMSDTLKLKLMSQQNEDWLGQHKTLKKLRYSEQHSNNDELKLAYE